MERLAYQQNKKNGDTYVYKCFSYWDKEKKAPRTKQTYIGKLDKNTGKIITKTHKSQSSNDSNEKKPFFDNTDPSLKSDDKSNVLPIEAETKVAGPSLLLDKIVKKIGLLELLKICFPDDYLEIMSIVYFIVETGLALYRCDPWSIGHLHPAGEQLCSQRISELLANITENDRQKFLSLWLDKISETEYLCYDTTSISSYAKNNEFVRRGHNKDGDKLPQINLAMLYGQKSGLPAYYRRLLGNINDVSTLKVTIKNLDFLRANIMYMILDRGFYSIDNVDALIKNHINFDLAVPISRKWVRIIIDKHKDKITYPDNYLQLNEDEMVYAATEKFNWGEEVGENKKKLYIHVYYNEQASALDYAKFIKKLLQYKSEVLENKTIESHQDNYDQYLIITKTSKGKIDVQFNNEEIDKYHANYSGFFCIISSYDKDKANVLKIYRNKDLVEKSFDNLKNRLDLKRLRMHSANTMDSRIFLQFLALILISDIQHSMTEMEIIKNFSMRELMEHLESLIQIKYKGQCGKHYSEKNRIQKIILKNFDISWGAP
jgi:transposase